MMVVVGDCAGGGGKYGTPAAGVIIYLAPEIGPADTAGRFNGRTMLELTKTKTKHQLGDFFFHFSFASFTSVRSFSLFLSLSLALSSRPLYSPSFGHVEEEERRRCVYMRGPPMASSVSFFSHQRSNPRTPSRTACPSPSCGNEAAHFKLYTRPLAPR